MELIKTFPKGSTVEVSQTLNRPQYRTCSANGSVCKYSSDIYRAMNFAQIFEDYYNPDSTKKGF